MLWFSFTPRFMRWVINWLLFLASWVFLETPVYAVVVFNDTGITTCSDVDTNGLPCPVTGFPGQDAEYGTNSFSFTKIDNNGNPLPVVTASHACVRDNITGLLWEEKTDDGGLRDKDWTYTGYNGNDDDPVGTPNGGTCATTGRCDTAKFIQDVNATNLCGHTDWRLPDPYELVSLVDYSMNPGPMVNRDYFLNAVDGDFWTVSPISFNNEYYWVVNFSYGSVGFNNYYNKTRVRLVRGGTQHISSFLNNADGTVTDNDTGLMWEKCVEGRSGTNCAGTVTAMTWKQALTTAQNSTLAGHTDWRLPNVKELQSLVNYNIYNPALISTFFPNTPADYYWTASPSAYSDYYSWSQYTTKFLLKN